jgi:hypothetical protein
VCAADYLRPLRAVLPGAGRQRLQQRAAGGAGRDRRAELERAAHRHLRLPAVTVLSS